ncbi:hypothetical protein [Campylobacter insulaenigrae]|uniref:hypothetical protein n=1 Tax=Campylobacter insulaenigrae TaxID=260714 RepID=UPI0021520A82|nr:hypothetical protein [Campylobacter insulaenigrae]MCR6594623.1 hypothetical protein [Campylobacter insulaenigrae]
MDIFFILAYYIDFIFEVDLFSFVDNDFIQSVNYRSGGNISKLDSILGIVASIFVKLIFCIIIIVAILSYILEKLRDKS